MNIVRTAVIIFSVLLPFVASGRNFVNLSPILMAHENSPLCPAATKKIISDWKNDTLKQVSSSLLHPTDYSPCNGKVDWSELVYSITDPLWLKEFNPQGVCAQSYGPVVWLFIEAWSDSGDDVSLSQIRVISMSSDYGNVLGHEFDKLKTMAYQKDACEGIKRNGTVVTSGAGTIKCARVAVLVRMKSFTCTDADSLQYAGDWILWHKNFTVSYLAYLSGNSESSTASVSIDGPVHVNRPVYVHINRDSVATLPYADTEKSFRLYRRHAVTLDTKQIGVVYGKGSLYIPGYDPYMHMLVVKPQW